MPQPFSPVPSGAVDGSADPTAEDLDLSGAAALYRRIFEEAGEGIAITDHAGTIYEVNGSFCRLLGYEREALLRTRVVDLIHPEDLVRRPEDLDRLEAGLTIVSERRMRRSDGTFVVVEGTGRKLDEDRYLTFTRDITRRREAEEALERNRHVFKRITDASPDILFIFDLIKRRNIYSNRQVTRILGYSLAEVQLLGAELIPSLCHPDDLAYLLDQHSRYDSVRDGEVLEYEYRARHKDGSYRWLRTRGVVFTRTPDGRAQQMLGVAQDVTARKQDEICLCTLNEELQREAQRKDEFLAMLAHELRNPLAPILNALEIIRVREAAGQPISRQREVIERQAHHLARLVDDLLDVSRITRGAIELRVERVDLNGLVEQAVQSCLGQIERHRHQLRTVVPPTPVWVDADPTRLVQVLSNLLNNAAKYTPDGGEISLRLEVAARGISNGSGSGSEHAPAPLARVHLRDNGRGITPDLLPHVFDLFVQEQRSLDRSEGGLGIGLTMVKRLVELHGGSVEARSAGPGSGTEFVVGLPVAAGE